MPEAGGHTINIVGVGNTLMGDDGVGPAVAQAIAARGALPAAACVHDAGLAVTDILGRLDPLDPLIVIDAVAAGGRPGTVYRARFDEMSLGEGTSGGCLSLHELSIGPALRIEAVTGRAFRDVTVFGIEPGLVAWGTGLSPAVADAVDSVADAVLERVDDLSAAPAAREAAR